MGHGPTKQAFVLPLTYTNEVVFHSIDFESTHANGHQDSTSLGIQHLKLAGLNHDSHPSRVETKINTKRKSTQTSDKGVADLLKCFDLI